MRGCGMGALANKSQDAETPRDGGCHIAAPMLCFGLRLAFLTSSCFGECNPW